MIRLKLVLAIFLQVSGYAYGEETSSDGAVNVLRIVDANQDGFVDDSEWTRFSSLRKFAEKHGIDTSQPVDISMAGGALDVVQEKLSNAKQRPVVKNVLNVVDHSSANPRGPWKNKSKLPERYQEYDANGDGQVAMSEWPRENRREFMRLDRNNDGFIEPREVSK